MGVIPISSICLGGSPQASGVAITPPGICPTSAPAEVLIQVKTARSPAQSG